ncbi:MAG: Fis family transcriptional regulator [Gammaproteobacteria bacterium]
MKTQTNGRRQAVTFKRTIVRLIERGMARERIGRQELAHRLRASRALVDRVLDPGNTAVRLDAAMKAAQAVNQRLRIVLGD